MPLSMDQTASQHKKTSLARLIVVNLALLAALLIALEGMASYALFLGAAKSTASLAERRHTRYDAELGWVNEPNVYIPDMYGPGVYLRTHARGFRSDHEISDTVLNGKTRIMCSGDSFTLGYGRRDAATIDHQVQLLTFITDDFYRMLSDSFSGYGKPVIEVEHDTLVMTKVPVSRRAYYFTSVNQIANNLKSLRTVEILGRFLRRVSVGRADLHEATLKEKDEKAPAIGRL